MRAGAIELVPMVEQHRAALREVCAEDPDIWQIYSISYGPEQFDASFDLLRSRSNWFPFSIFSDGRPVGMSCYINVEADRGVLEIGNTYLSPSLRGTGFNRKLKELMLGRAFACGFRRIEFRVDARNLRSQGAMAKLGAVREGVIRQERITWNGHVRDTVLFSILADEWRG